MDTNNILLVVIIISMAVVAVLSLFLIYRVTAIMNRAVDIYDKYVNKYQPSVKTFSSDQTGKPNYEIPAIKNNNVRVEQLEPDMIAPALKRPPRPVGGFGSKVND